MKRSPEQAFAQWQAAEELALNEARRYDLWCATMTPDEVMACRVNITFLNIWAATMRLEWLEAAVAA